MPPLGRSPKPTEKICQRCSTTFTGMPRRVVCPPCRDEIRREHARKPEQQQKTATRRATARDIRLGRLVRRPCEVCGADEVQVHHENYADPAAIVWLCRDDHWARHRSIKTPLAEWLAENRVRARWAPIERRAIEITRVIRASDPLPWWQRD